MVTKKSTSNKSSKVISDNKEQRKSLPPTLVAALILTVCAVIFAWVPFLGLVLGIVGFTFAILGYRDSKSHPLGSNIGIGSIIFSSLVVIFQIFLMLGILLLFTSLNFADNLEGSCVANSTSINCDNLSLTLDGSVFTVDVETNDLGEVISMDIDAHSR